MFPYGSRAFFSFTLLEDVSRRLISLDEYFTAETKNSNRETKATSHERPGYALLLQKFPLSHEHSVHTIAPSFAQLEGVALPATTPSLHTQTHTHTDYRVREKRFPSAQSCQCTDMNRAQRAIIKSMIYILSD